MIAYYIIILYKYYIAMFIEYSIIALYPCDMNRNIKYSNGISSKFSNKLFVYIKDFILLCNCI